jgi:hypothetical protein
MQNNQGKFRWDDEKMARVFNTVVQKHILSLRISYLIKGVPQVLWVSGFLILTKYFLGWMTAGHVLKEINKLLQTEGVGGIKARWFDNSDNKNAQSIPCDLADLILHGIDTDGYDFGVVPLPPYYANLILAIKENQPLTEAHWRSDDSFEPEGYYIVGIPQEFTEFKQLSNGPEIYEYKSSGVCLSAPVIKEDAAKHSSEDEFWRHDNNFYGKVLPIHDDNGNELIDIKGMSGGPIFGVRSIDKDKIQYRIIAIQSNWLSQSKFTRGTRFADVMKLLNDAIERTRPSES